MIVNRNKCDICGVCVAVCPVDAITVSEYYICIDNEKCIACENCLIACPAKAISPDKYGEGHLTTKSMKEKENVSYQQFSGQTVRTTESVDASDLEIREEYDVVVVGAGPGGSVSARFAAESNLTVLILERDKEAGIPVRCAEGISGGKLDTFIDLKPKHIAAKITRARLNTPNGKHLEMSSNLQGYVLERRVFDNALCDEACKKGARMLTKANVVGMERTPEGRMRVFFRHNDKLKQVLSKIVIGADGVESRVGRWAGLKTALALNDISTSAQYTLNNIKVDTNLISFYFGNKIAPGGYLWVFPKSDTSANVGLGIAGNYAKEKPAKDYLDDFISQNFPKASISYTVYSGVPITKTLEHIVTDNVMLVGDAARQVNPITGGGIKQAMIAGKIAGEVAAEAVRKGDYSIKILSKYENEWDKTLGSKHRFIYKIKEKVLTASDERLNKISDICKDIPPEKMSLPELFKAVIKGDPKLVAEMATAFVLSKINF